MGTAYALYAVVDRDGKLLHRSTKQGGGPKIYTTLAAAQRQATYPGDNVVELTLNLDREPLFIRGGK